MTTPDMPNADLRQQQVDQIVDEFNITLHQNGWRVWEGVERLANEVARLREALAAMEDHRDGWRKQADEYHRLWTMEVLEARKLRERLAAVEAERDDYKTLLEVSAPDAMKLVLKVYADLYDATRRADKAERILAALRKPSEAVLLAAARFDTLEGLRAAVAAAEQEVSDDPR